MKIKATDILIYLLKVLIISFILFIAAEKPMLLATLLSLSPLSYIVLIVICLFIIFLFAYTAPQGGTIIRTIYPLLIVIGVLTLYGLQYAFRYVSNFDEIKYINNVINEADDILFYEDEIQFSENIKFTKFNRNVILIDYDTMKVSFLFNNGKDQFLEFILLEDTKDTYKKYEYDIDEIQIEAPLVGQGMVIETYYPNEESSNLTSIIRLVMEDGKTYSAYDIECDLGLKNSAYCY